MKAEDSFEANASMVTDEFKNRPKLVSSGMHTLGTATNATHTSRNSPESFQSSHERPSNLRN